MAKDRPPTKWNENAVEDGRDDVDEMVAARLARGRATRMNVGIMVWWRFWDDDRVRFLRMIMGTLHASCASQQTDIDLPILGTTSRYHIAKHLPC